MPDATPVISPAAPALRRKSFIRRWWWRFGLIALVVLIVIIAALPTILSSAPATRSIVSFVNGSIPGTLELDDLSLGWFSAMRVDGLRLRDPAGNIVASVKSIDAPDASLRRVLGAYTHPGVVRIVEPGAEIVADADGTTNLMRALFKHEDRAAKPDKPEIASKPEKSVQFGDVSFRIEIDNARISYTAPDIERVELLARSTTLDVSSLHEQTLKLDATVRQGDEEGLIAATVKFSELIDDSLTMQSEKAHVEADVALKAMPIPLADRLSNQQGKLVALLGPKLDATLKADGPLGQLTADLVVKSQNLDANAALGMQNQQLALKPGSRVALIVTPAAYAAFMEAGATPELSTSFDIVILINQLTLDQTHNQARLDTAAVDVEIAVGDIHLDAGPTIGRLDLQQTRLSAKTPRLADKLTIALSSHAQQTLAKREASGGGTISLTADLGRLINADGSFNTTPSALVDATISDLPVILVDELGQLGGMATAALGPKLNASVEADLLPTIDGWVTGKVKFIASSQHLNVDIDAMLADTGLTATPGSQITLAVQPALFDKFLATPDKTAAVRLTQPFDVKLQLAKLNAPRTNGQIALNAFAIDSQVTVGDIILDGGQEIGQLALRDTMLAAKSAALGKALNLSLNTRAEHNGRGGGIQLRANVANLILPDGSVVLMPQATIDGAINDLPMAVVDQFGSLNGLASAAVGPTLNATVKGVFDPASGKGDLNLIARAVNLDAALGGTISNNIFNVGQGSRVILTLQPATVAKMLTPSESGAPPAITLASPATLTADLTQLVLPLKDFAADKATVGAKVRIDQLDLAGDPRVANAAVRDLVVDLPTVRLDQPIAATLKGQLQRGDRQGAIDGHVKLTNMVAPSAGARQTVIAALTLTAVPVELLDTLGQQQGKLVALLADVIDKVELAADVTLGDTPRYFATTKITDDRLTTDLGATYTSTGLEVRDGSWASITLTPEAFAAYNKLAAAEATSDTLPLQLTEPLTLRAEFKRSLLALGDAGLDPTRTQLDARMTSKGLSVRQNSQAMPYAMRDIDVTIKTANLKDRLDLTAKAVIPSSTSPGQLTSITTITRLYNDANEIDINTLELTTDTLASSINVALLDVLSGMEGKLVDTLGDTAEMKAVGKFPGDLDITLKSPTTSGILKPTVTRDRTITLREDAVITLQLTERMAKSWLASLNPALGDATASKQPIRLTINRKPFDVPLSSTSMVQDMKLTGSLELGTLVMDRKGFVGGGVDAVVSQVLSKLGGRSQPPPEGTYEVDFTPMTFRIANGRVKPGELWMTSSDMGIGLQGDVDLVGQTVNMTMGMLGATLIAKAPSGTGSEVAKAIEPGRIYELKVSGPADNPTIDYAGLIGSLAVGAAKQQLEGEARAGVDLLEGLVRGATKQPTNAMQWSPPSAAAELVKNLTVPAQSQGPAQPLTPDERQRRREQRQPGQPQEAQPQEEPKPASPLDQLFEEIVPKEEPAKPAQPVVSEEERARRREERQRQREAERQKQNQ